MLFFHKYIHFFLNSIFYLYLVQYVHIEMYLGKIFFIYYSSFFVIYFRIEYYIIINN